MIKKVFVVVMTALAVITTAFTGNKAYASSNVIKGPDIVFKDSKQSLTVQDILDLYSVSGKELEIIADEYTGKGNRPGIYNITIGVVNSFTTRDIEVHVKQTISDVAYAASLTDDKYQIYTTKDKVLSPREIVKIVERISDLQIITNSGVRVNNDTYTENNESPGVYVYEFTIVSPNGTQSTYAVDIHVRNTQSFNPDFEFKGGTTFKSILNITLIILAVIMVLFVAYKLFTRKVGKR